MGPDSGQLQPKEVQEGLSQQRVGFEYVLGGQLYTVQPMRLTLCLCRNLLAHKGPAHSQCAG